MGIRKWTLSEWMYEWISECTVWGEKSVRCHQTFKFVKKLLFFGLEIKQPAKKFFSWTNTSFHVWKVLKKFFFGNTSVKFCGVKMHKTGVLVPPDSWRAWAWSPSPGWCGGRWSPPGSLLSGSSPNCRVWTIIFILKSILHHKKQCCGSVVNWAPWALGPGSMILNKGSGSLKFVNFWFNEIQGKKFNIYKTWWFNNLFNSPKNVHVGCGSNRIRY